MKIDCDYFKERRRAKDEEIRARVEQWHDWYAWWPTRIGYGDCRWLETIQRRGHFGYRYNDFSWEYMPKETTLEQAGK